MNKKIPEDFSLNFNDLNIYPIKQIRNQGVILDQKFSFKSHVNIVCSKAKTHYYGLTELSTLLKNPQDKSLLIALYYHIWNTAL